MFGKLPAIKLKPKKPFETISKTLLFSLLGGKLVIVVWLCKKYHPACNTVMTLVNEKWKFKDFAFTCSILLFSTSLVGKSIERKNVGGLTCVTVKGMDCQASFTYFHLIYRQEGSFTWSYFQCITKATEIPVKPVYGEQFTTGQRSTKANSF